MKKYLIIILFIFCLTFLNANALSLKGGVVEEYIPEGFFGSWGVISKLNNSNNPTMFNFESRDIWMLSGRGNILVLQNLESGAYSEIVIKDKPQDNSTLKFNREKTVEKNGQKTVYKEIVSFKLQGDNFSGTDEFIVEKHEGNKLIKKDYANYNIAGVRISGGKPN